MLRALNALDTLEGFLPDPGISPIAVTSMLQDATRKHASKPPPHSIDRSPHCETLHMQSLCAMGHFDGNQAGACSYDQAFQLARRLHLPQPVLTELYRRSLFNILARN